MHEKVKDKPATDKRNYPFHCDFTLILFNVILCFQILRRHIFNYFQRYFEFLNHFFLIINFIIFYDFFLRARKLGKVSEFLYYLKFLEALVVQFFIDALL